MGIVGAALAIILSYWLNVVLLGFYMKYSSECEKTRSVFSKDVFFSIREFFRFAVPSAAMTCLELWSYEVLILLSGLLPNPKEETSVLSIWVARGNGRQKFGAYVNLGAYYLVGTPVAAVLDFVLHLRGKFLLIGLATGSCVQASLLALSTIFTDWHEYGFNPNKSLPQIDLFLR